MASLTAAVASAALRRADHIAIVSNTQSYTWSQWTDRIARLAAIFRQHGVQSGDRVAVLGQNSHRLIESLYAAMWAGGIGVPLNWRLSLPELIATAQDCEPTVLVVDPEFAEASHAIAAHLPGLRARICMGEDQAPAGLLGYEEALRSAHPIADAGRGGDDIACMIYTGGTTGKAKGVMLSHTSLHQNVLNVLPVIPFDEDIVHLHCGPLFHLSPLWRVFTVTHLAGRHVVMRKFVASEVLEVVRRERVTAAALVPTMIATLLDLPDFSASDVASLRVIVYGASPISDTLMQRLVQVLPGCLLYQGYGMSETSPVITFLTDEDHRRRPDKLRSAGRPVPNVEVRIAGTDDSSATEGTVGEILVRAPTVMSGYWRQPELTLQTLRGGWMHTGDAGYLDADGYLYIVDRLKDMVVTGGENVYSGEVENAILRHPAVAECAVFGIPDAQWGEAVHAVVVPKPGATVGADDIRAFCREHIAGYKCPRSVELRSEPLPLSAVNKVVKAALRAPWWDGRRQQVA